MIFEVHMYLGVACVTDKASYDYPIGEKHAFLFYLKEDKNAEYNPDRAEELISKLGFDKIEFSKAGKLDPDRVVGSDKEEYYDHAMKSGSSFVLYEDPM